MGSRKENLSPDGTPKRPRLYVEITNVCGRNCAFCPGTKRPPHAMDLAFFSAHLPAFSAYFSKIYLHVMGDPLAHPDFPRFVEACNTAGLPVEIVSNGLRIPENTGALLNPIVRQVNFSLQALRDPEELEPVLDFLSTALERRGDLYLNLRIWRTDRTFFFKTVLARITSYFQVELPAPDALKCGHFQIRNRLYLHGAVPFLWPGESTPSPEDESAFCLGGRDQLAVLSDGTCVPCCLDADAHMALGNLHETSFPDILASERLRRLTAGFAAHRAVEPFCRTCSYRRRFTD